MFIPTGISLRNIGVLINSADKRKVCQLGKHAQLLIIFALLIHLNIQAAIIVFLMTLQSKIKSMLTRQN